jgi:two-component system sensor histidine kinase ChvG
MAWAINTKKNKHGDKSAPPIKKRSGGLTLRILSVNIIAPVVLVVGLLYLGQYRESLIKAELETLRAQSQLFAGAIAEGAVRPVETGKPLFFAKPEEIEMLIPELSRRMVRRLGETTDSRTRLFDNKGKLIGDSHQLIGPGGMVQIVSLDPPRDSYAFSAMVAYIGTKILELMPARTQFPKYRHISSSRAEDFPDVPKAMLGEVNATAWQDADGKIILSAAAPVQKVKNIMGTVLLTRDGHEIEAAMTRVRFDVLTGFLGALSVTIFLSLYLAGIIGRPLKKLAKAAEAVRQGKGRHIDIPDLSHRQDEIGELSHALQDMTQALWDRMDTIERFAADVAHELKNPLTSLRSAVETASKVKGKDREKLMGIIQHDVLRLDRLISDISNASRLDAELSREEMTPVDIKGLLERLIDAHKKPLERASKASTEAESENIALDAPQGLPIYGRGNEGRLAQVFENLISNALSFSPADKQVHIKITDTARDITVTIENEGPQIPENKLEAIFERFYTERPKHEDYGRHSGLGLSIAKQIIDAHHGHIFAENIAGHGARFTVILTKT